LTRYGFVDIERITVPFAWEFADPELFARAIGSMGPAYEAMENAGEQDFVAFAVEQAGEHVPAGLPLRATIDAVGYLATNQRDAPETPRRGHRRRA